MGNEILRRNKASWRASAHDAPRYDTIARTFPKSLLRHAITALADTIASAPFSCANNDWLFELFHHHYRKGYPRWLNSPSGKKTGGIKAVVFRTCLFSNWLQVSCLYRKKSLITKEQFYCLSRCVFSFPRGFSRYNVSFIGIIYWYYLKYTE